MQLIRFDLTLEIQGPVITSNSGVGHAGIDMVMARTADLETDGKTRYYLPGTHLKGLLREAWQNFGIADAEVEKWLGKESASEEQDGPNEPARGRLQFGDAFDRKTNPEDPHPLHFRTKIDPERGSVDEGMLLMIEAPYKPGEPYTFQAKLQVLLRGDETAESLRQRIEAAFAWTMAVGAEKSVGFGRILRASVKASPVSPQSVPEATDRYELALTFDRPFCFAKPKLNSNMFESFETVPGSSIRASLANMAQEEKGKYKTLLDNLHAIVCTDLFAEEAGMRSVRFPHSLVQTEKKVYRDAVLCKEPPAGIGMELRFSVDWKPSEFPPEGYDWPWPEYEVRVRTAIEGEKRKVLDEALFAYEMVVPRVAWRGYLDLSEVAANTREQVRRQVLELLGHGLHGLGKTKAWAKVSVTAAAQPAIPSGNVLAVTLQSAALLLQPNRVEAVGLHAAYAEAFQSLSSALELQHFFQRTSLYGGEYVYRRFQQKPGDKLYRPYWLTEPGSVFVFKSTEAARTFLAGAMKTNLPIPEATRKFYQLTEKPEPLDWQRCPCLPQNGFGEIAVNLHVSRAAAVPLLTAKDLEGSHV